MNVYQIVVDYLKTHGYDGLCSQSCGCGIDNLMPCESDIVAGCKPAVKTKCTPDHCPNPDECPGYGDSDKNRTCYRPREADKK